MIFHPLNFCLGLGIAFSFGLLFMRFHLSGNERYLFLVWNLFLAGLPLVASTTLKFLHESGKWRWCAAWPLMFFWLAFLPNAPYILTDLFHLKATRHVPLWLDLMLILSFAWNGLIFGLISVLDMQNIFSERWTRFSGWIIAIGALIASSFGIYLGRFLRWNTWDIVSRPEALLKDIISPILHPLQHPTPLGVTLSFSVFLILVYLTLHALLRQYRLNNV